MHGNGAKAGNVRIRRRSNTARDIDGLPSQSLYPALKFSGEFEREQTRLPKTMRLAGQSTGVLPNDFGHVRLKPSMEMFP